jgi:hypothetical protein
MQRVTSAIGGFDQTSMVTVDVTVVPARGRWRAQA